MYESSHMQHARSTHYGEPRGILSVSSNACNNTYQGDKIRPVPFVEISSSDSTYKSWNSFDGSPPQTSVYASNTHKHLSSHSPETGSSLGKRRKESTSAVMTVEPASSVVFVARLKKRSVYSLDEEDTTEHKDELPKVVRERLERWYTRYGRSIPPCASRTHIQPSRGDDTCEWTHVPTGEKLHVFVYTMSKANDPRPSQGHSKRLIIAQGSTQGPFIVQFFDNRPRRKNVHESRFRIWHGVDSGSALFAGDRDGFEHLPSVIKTSLPRSSLEDCEISDDEDEDPISAQIPRSRRNIAEQSRRLRSSRPSAQLHVGLQSPSIKKDNAAHTAQSTAEGLERSPGCSGVLKRPKNFGMLCNGRATQMSLSSSEIQTQPYLSMSGLSRSELRQEPSSSGTCPHQPLAATPVGQERINSLSKHIRENAEFWFLPLHGKRPPRIRPYHSCDTAKTLFGHARSARVFDPSPEIANVLSIRMWDDVDAMTLMEEDDPKFKEQDYEAFLASLREASCWIWIDGQWTGDATVEVKAMQ